MLFQCCDVLGTVCRPRREHRDPLIWGGLRGALALALVLALPHNLLRHGDMVTITIAVVAFSIFVQGLTIMPFLQRLKLSDANVGEQ